MSEKMYRVELHCFSTRGACFTWGMNRVLKEGLTLDEADRYAMEHAWDYPYLLMLDWDGYSVDVVEMFGNHEVYCGYEYSSEYGVNEW